MIVIGIVVKISPDSQCQYSQCGHCVFSTFSIFSKRVASIFRKKRSAAVNMNETIFRKEILRDLEHARVPRTR